LPAFLGAVIWKQFELFRYFYNSKIDDFLLITLITVISGLVTYKYLNFNKRTLALIQGITLIIGLVIFKITYQVFQDFDLLSMSTYFFCMLSAVSLIAPLKVQENGPLASVITLLSILVGGVAQFLAGGSFIIILLAALYLVISFVHERLQLEGKFHWVHGLLFLFLIALSPVIGSVPNLYKNQRSYVDKVVYSQDTPFQTIDVTEWKGQRWYYYNGINNFSTIDEWLYYEPLVHPVLEIAEKAQNILVIGGDNGLAIREVLEHEDVKQIQHLILDTALYHLAKSSSLFTTINQQSLDDSKVKSQREHIFRHLHKVDSVYDIIIIDIPDPVDLELNQYYTQEFYELCYKALSQNGLLITHAGSPYFATQAYYCISNTVKASQFSVLEMHNQVLTMGEWGWIIGTKNFDSSQLRSKAMGLNFDHLSTTWLNNEAMNMMLSFGKLNININDSIVNTIKKPVVHSFYNNGNWNFNF
jgi:spermidine synthase